MEDEPSASCLLSGSYVTLTCDIVGYPRPQIIFSRASIEIDSSKNSRIKNTHFDLVQMRAICPAPAKLGFSWRELSSCCSSCCCSCGVHVFLVCLLLMCYSVM